MPCDTCDMSFPVMVLENVNHPTCLLCPRKWGTEGLSKVRGWASNCHVRGITRIVRQKDASSILAYLSHHFSWLANTSPKYSKVGDISHSKPQINPPQPRNPHGFRGFTPAVAVAVAPG